MRVWIDAQLPPSLAHWLRERFGVDAVAVRDVGLRDATDATIFDRARLESAVVITKDSDFVRLLESHGAPPQVVWLTCGNTSNVRLRALFERVWPKVQALLESGEPLIEISSTPR